MRIKVGYKDIEGSAHRCMPSPQRNRIASATSSAIISVPTRGRPLTVYHKSICTQSRDRTGTNLRPLVFETNASTDSAIWAFVEDAANIGAFLRSRKPEGDGGRFGAGVTSFLTAFCCTSRPELWRGLRVCHRPGERRTSFAPPTAWRHRRGRPASAVR